MLFHVLLLLLCHCTCRFFAFLYFEIAVLAENIRSSGTRGWTLQSFSMLTLWTNVVKWFFLGWGRYVWSYSSHYQLHLQIIRQFLNQNYHNFSTYLQSLDLTLQTFDKVGHTLAVQTCLPLLFWGGRSVNILSFSCWITQLLLIKIILNPFFFVVNSRLRCSLNVRRHEQLLVLFVF